MSDSEHPDQPAAPPAEHEEVPDVPEAPPEHVPEYDSDGESVLSDIDDEVFKEFDDSVIGGNVIPIDEETVHAIGKHKIKRQPNEAAVSGAGKKKEKRRRDIKRRRDDDEDEGPARRDVPEVELTPVESM